MSNVINIVKNNSVTIMKIGGMVLSIGGTVLAGIANDKQQKIDIAKAVKDFKGSAN